MPGLWPAPTAARLRLSPRRPIARGSRRVRVLLAVLLLLSTLRPAAAQTLGLTLTPSALTGLPGSTLTFSGRITNVTGTSLSSTDLFLNFSGYDPAVFADITQILGTTSFVVPNNSVSAAVPLFSVLIGSSVPIGSYGMSVSLQSVNDVVSNDASATVNVGIIPEPSTVALLSSGLLVVPLAGRWRRRRAQAGAPSSSAGV